ncbi:MAG: magnesium transporter [Chlamydiales bacterium]|nr:magnesium transporter [Chlamydiales bacterium]
MRIDTTKRISQRDLESPIREFTDPFPYHFTINQSVEEVLYTLQSVKAEKRVEYLYITDRENKLQGVLDLSDLLYNSPKTLLIDLIDTDVMYVTKEEPLEKGLKLLAANQILIIPVVNEIKQFVGVLEIYPFSHDPRYEAKKIHYKNLKADIFQFIGFSIEQRKYASSWQEYRLRMPWLLCNLVGGLICAVISEFLQGPLVEVVLIAFFIPLVLGLGESIGIQSMTLSLRFLHIRKIHWRQVWRRILVEGRSSFLLGLTSAVIITFFYFAWSLEIMPVIAISSSIVLVMITAGLFGAIFPIVLHALRLDPKVAAGPVVLMMSDIFTITIYLGLNTLILI